MTSKKLDILVAEDGYFTEAREAAERVASEEDVNVQVVETAREGYDLISKGNLDYVITDMMFKEEFPDNINRKEYDLICDKARDEVLKNLYESRYFNCFYEINGRENRKAKTIKNWYAMKNGVPNELGLESFVSEHGVSLGLLGSKLKKDSTLREELERLNLIKYKIDKDYPIKTRTYIDIGNIQEIWKTHYKNGQGRKDLQEIKKRLSVNYEGECYKEFPLGLPLFFKAWEKGIPATIFTNTDHHGDFIDYEHLMTPLYIKGFLDKNRYDDYSKKEDPVLNSFWSGTGSIIIEAYEGYLPLFVYDVFKKGYQSENKPQTCDPFYYSMQNTVRFLKENKAKQTQNVSFTKTSNKDKEVI